MKTELPAWLIPPRLSPALNLLLLAVLATAMLGIGALLSWFWYPNEAAPEVSSASAADLRELARRGDLTALRAQRRPALREADAGGWTLLHWAAESGQEDTVRWLLAQGVDAGSRDRLGQSALDVAVTAGHAGIVEILLERGSGKDRGEALALAIRSGRAPSTEALLTDFSVLDGPLTAAGLPPLHMAALHGRDDIVAELLRHGAGVNIAAGPAERTPLHLAALGGAEQVVQRLLAEGAERDRPDGYGLTALHLAASAGQPSVVAALLAAGSDPERESPGGTTLALAIDMGHLDIVEMLVP